LSTSFFDLYLNLRIGLEVQVPHRVLVAAAPRRGHDDAVVVAKKQQGTDPALAGLAADRGQQSYRRLGEGAAESASAALLHEGVYPRHPFDEEVGKRRIQVTRR
jgi:hypothetical protein